MLNNAPKTVKSFIWLLIFFQSGFGPLSNVTLCMEDDGQINMEIACDCPSGNSGEHTTYRSLSSFKSPNKVTLIDQCYPCVDISFSFKSDIHIIRTQHKVFEITSPVFSPNPVYLPTSANVFAQGSLYQPPLATYHTRSLLCTVVLLI